MNEEQDDPTTGATSCNFKRKLRVCYPPGRGRVVLRTETDWEREIRPLEVSDDGATALFEVEARQTFIHFKPCLVKNGSLHWAGGPDNFLNMTGQNVRVVYPYFFSDPHGHFLPLLEIESPILGRQHRLRVTCRRATRKTPWRITRSPTCRMDRTFSFPPKPFSKKSGKSMKPARSCGRCRRSRI